MTSVPGHSNAELTVAQRAILRSVIVGLGVGSFYVYRAVGLPTAPAAVAAVLNWGWLAS